MHNCLIVREAFLGALDYNLTNSFIWGYLRLHSPQLWAPGGYPFGPSLATALHASPQLCARAATRPARSLLPPCMAPLNFAPWAASSFARALLRTSIPPSTLRPGGYPAHSCSCYGPSCPWTLRLGSYRLARPLPRPCMPSQLGAHAATVSPALAMALHDPSTLRPRSYRLARPLPRPCK